MERRSRGTPGQTKKMTRTPNTVSGWQKAKLQHKASHYAAHSPCSGLRYYFRFTRGSAAKRLHPGLRLYRPTGSKLRALRAPEQIDKLQSTKLWDTCDIWSFGAQNFNPAYLKEGTEVPHPNKYQSGKIWNTSGLYSTPPPGARYNE